MFADFHDLEWSSIGAKSTSGQPSRQKCAVRRVYQSFRPWPRDPAVCVPPSEANRKCPQMTKSESTQIPTIGDSIAAIEYSEKLKLVILAAMWYPDKLNMVLLAAISCH